MLQCHQLPSGRAACDSRLESPLPAVKSHPPQPFSLGSSGGPDPLGLLTPLSWLVFSLPGPHHSQASSSEKGVCPDGQLLASPTSSRVTFLVPRATKHTGAREGLQAKPGQEPNSGSALLPQTVAQGWALPWEPEGEAVLSLADPQRTGALYSPGKGEGCWAAWPQARSCEELSVVSSSGSGNNSPLSFLAELAERVFLQG